MKSTQKKEFAIYVPRGTMAISKAEMKKIYSLWSFLRHKGLMEEYQEWWELVQNE